MQQWTVIMPLKYKQGVKGGIYHALCPVLDFSLISLVGSQRRKQIMKTSWKKITALLMAFALAVVIAPVSAKAEPKQNASDLAALNKIMTAQNANGGHVPSDSSFYDWTEINGELRLTGIYWNDGLNGAVSFTGFPELTTLECTNGSVTKINISKNKKLTRLVVNNNKLTSLNLTNNPKLDNVICYGNKIKAINVTKCSKLAYLDCSGNALKSLNVTKNKNLLSLDCSGNKLTKLNVTKCPKLEDLSCKENKLTSLNLTKSKALTRLSCASNKIKKLDITACPYVSFANDEDADIEIIGRED